MCDSFFHTSFLSLTKCRCDRGSNPFQWFPWFAVLFHEAGVCLSRVNGLSHCIAVSSRLSAVSSSSQKSLPIVNSLFLVVIVTIDDEVAMWGNKIPQEEPKFLFRIAFYILENWKKTYEKKIQKKKSVRNDISTNVDVVKICNGPEQKKISFNHCDPWPPMVGEGPWSTQLSTPCLCWPVQGRF